MVLKNLVYSAVRLLEHVQKQQLLVKIEQLKIADNPIPRLFACLARHSLIVGIGHSGSGRVVEVS